ncbi:MAG TPA: AAA domain-containing protein [Vicinamibacterales bacterium]|nr:AAA domain-containing protein [Vicinamibacterales bacterium]
MTDQHERTSSRLLLHRLLDYIHEQAKEVDPRGYRLGAVKGFVRRSDELVGLPGVESDLKVAGDHIWLRIQRLEGNAPPPIPDSQKGLFRVSKNPEGPLPELDEAALLHWLEKAGREKTPQERVELEAQVRAETHQSLVGYTGLWSAWAEGERPRRRTITLYADLFALKHQLEAEETAKPQEFVCGIGISYWQLQFDGSSIPFEYPLLTQAVEISLDDRTLALEVRPRATDTNVELDAFIACQVRGAADVERAIREHLSRHKDAPVSPFDNSSYSDVLKLAAGNLDPEGNFRDVIVPGAARPGPGEHLIVTGAWVLLSRPRSNNYLFEDLKRLQAKLESGCTIPAGPEALVTSPSDEPVKYETVRFRGISSRGDSGPDKPEELYFPLPYNEEQVTIIQRLERSPGVTVQGPPGTGKTHTIANIVCHYLATGRRVLVTSRGERALEVLQTKMPDQVRALTVSLLASDREGVRQFQAAIESIQHQVSQLNPEQTQRDILTTQSAIDRAHIELARIDARTDEIAHSQLADVDIDGVPMRAQGLADLVVSGRAQYGWFDDPLSLSTEHAPPFSGDEAEELRSARRRLAVDVEYTRHTIPSPGDLPNVAAIAELHDVLSRLKTLDGQIASGELIGLRATTSEVLQAARALLARVEEALTLAKELESVDGGWPFELRTKCRDSAFVSERRALEALYPELEAIVEARAEFLKRPVEFPEEGLTNIKTRQAVERGATSGKPFGFVSLGNGQAKEHLGRVRIAGRSAEGLEDWTHVLRYVGLHEQVLSFATRWNEIAEGLSAPPLQAGIRFVRTVELVATTGYKAHRLATDYDQDLPKRAMAVFDEPPTAQLLGGVQELAVVREQLLRHLTRADLSRAVTNLAVLKEKLAGKTGPVSERFRGFVEHTLGSPEISAERAVAEYSDLGAELQRLAGRASDMSKVRDLSQRIENAGAPRLAGRLCCQAAEANVDDSVFPTTWRKAWTWARVRTHLETIEARHELVAMAARRRDLEAGLSRLYKDMVAKSAWLATKRNATPRVLQALAGYATAIRRIGQGTGPNATRYRRDAREAMLDAAGAVPCWIMSHARISEAMPADIGAFDLVIVDEASQSDLWALPAILRGKKILIVGDDKQVSPDAGFIASQRIQELKDRFLADQPYGTEMTPEKSLYDLAARVFAAQQVMLREHFRCVPPIIAYSNRTFYKGGIRPLRIPKPSERIDPPLVDVLVKDGVRNRRDCNEYEALAIADEIAGLLKDERFKSRTLGVVSLLGLEQAKHIDSVVRQRCDAAELLHRRFECGDARSFQGSERDIMFLSMVVDRTNSKALSGNLFDQRFNVAASRARDRMYLVRSVKSGDLSDKDLRLTLLAHFDKPMVTDETEEENLIDRCESGFERQVFTALTALGYRVVPQVKTGAYRIDMVVEGASDTRLAIECDGDEYHGPDRWQDDTKRQRVLERAGWTFWRCFASTWSLHRDDVLAELLERLTAMGIEPIGATDRVPSLVERREWAPPAADDDSPDEVAETLKRAVSTDGESV